MYLKMVFVKKFGATKRLWCTNTLIPDMYSFFTETESREWVPINYHKPQERKQL